jgi:hypothetical protein
MIWTLHVRNKNEERRIQEFCGEFNGERKGMYDPDLDKQLILTFILLTWTKW